MTLNRAKQGSVVTFIKYHAGMVSYIFLPQTSIWNEIRFPALNLLNLADLQRHLPVFLFYPIYNCLI